MAAKTKPITFRVSVELHKKISLRAAKSNNSAGGFARELTLKKLADEEAETQGLVEVLEQLKTIRREHALSTEVLLTAIGSEPDSHKVAAAWVRNNLNRD